MVKRQEGVRIFMNPTKFTEIIKIEGNKLISKDNIYADDSEQIIELDFEEVKELIITCGGKLKEFNILEHLHKFKNIEEITIEVRTNKEYDLHLKDLEYLEYLNLRNSEYKSLKLTLENCGNKSTYYGEYGNINVVLSNLKGLEDLTFINTRPYQIGVYDTDFFKTLLFGNNARHSYANNLLGMDADFLVEVLERSKNGDYEGAKDAFDSGLFEFKTK